MDFVDRGRLFDAFRRHGRLVALGGAWMLGKPVQLPKARHLYQGGLKIVSAIGSARRTPSTGWVGGSRGFGTPREAGNHAPRRAGRPEPRSRRRWTPATPLSSANSWWRPICAGGRRCWGTDAWASTRTRGPSTGPAGRSGCELLGTRLGFAERFHPPAAHLQKVEIHARSVGGDGVDLNDESKPGSGPWA